MRTVSEAQVHSGSASREFRHCQDDHLCQTSHYFHQTHGCQVGEYTSLNIYFNVIELAIETMLVSYSLCLKRACFYSQVINFQILLTCTIHHLTI